MIQAADWEKPIELCRMLGNSMSSNVLHRVMVPLVNAVRPDIDMQDPWATGRVQYLLRQSARAEQHSEVDSLYNTCLEEPTPAQRTMPPRPRAAALRAASQEKQ